VHGFPCTKVCLGSAVQVAVYRTLMWKRSKKHQVFFTVLALWSLDAMGICFTVDTAVYRTLMQKRSKNR
jgi:hypothetical protein